MDELKIQHIHFHPDSLRSALSALEEAIAKHTRMRDLITQLLAVQEGRPAPATEGRRGGGRGRRAAGEKTLRQAIREVLGQSSRPLKPVELKDAVLVHGYQTAAKPSSFYTAVFNTAGKDPAVGKNEEGGYYLADRRVLESPGMLDSEIEAAADERSGVKRDGRRGGRGRIRRA